MDQNRNGVFPKHNNEEDPPNKSFYITQTKLKKKQQQNYICKNHDVVLQTNHSYIKVEQKLTGFVYNGNSKHFREFESTDVKIAINDVCDAGSK